MAETGTIDEQTALARSLIYGSLARVFRAEPDEALIDELRRPECVDAYAELGADLGEDFRSAPASELLHELGLEYTRLFIGPGTHISAHESVFTEIDGDAGGLWGAATVRVKKFIESTGLVYANDYQDLPDHISAELEFMRRLIDWEVEHHRAGDGGAIRYGMRIQERFLDEHLGRWAPTLCRRIVDDAELPFYRVFADLMRDFLVFDRELVEGVLGSEPRRAVAS